MLSQTAEHALRATLFLARSSVGEPMSADVIAEALGAPRNYLSKTLNTLAKRGLLSSARGPYGGFQLVRAAEELTIAEVVHAFDEPRTRGICLLGGGPCNDAEPCGAHFRWKAVTAEMLAPLNNTTIADLLEDEVSDRVIAGIGAGIACQGA
ncbi:RrF2 family transcriptional regulator [soil metagenome]